LLGRLAAQPRHEPAGRLRVEHRLPRCHGAHRAHEVGATDLLEHVPGGARHDRVHQRVVVGERGQHQAGHFGQLRADLPADGHAVPVGQPDVEHGHIRAQRGDPGERRGCGARFANHLDVALSLKHVPHAPPDDLMVVEQEHLDRLGRVLVTSFGFHGASPETRCLT